MSAYVIVGYIGRKKGMKPKFVRGEVAADSLFDDGYHVDEVRVPPLAPAPASAPDRGANEARKQMRTTKADRHAAARFYEDSFDSLSGNETVTALAQLLARTRAEAVKKYIIAPAPKPARAKRKAKP